MFSAVSLKSLKNYCRALLPSAGTTDSLSPASLQLETSQKELRELKKTLRSVLSTIDNNTAKKKPASLLPEHELHNLLAKLEVVEKHTQELEHACFSAQKLALQSPEEEAEELALPNKSWLNPMPRKSTASTRAKGRKALKKHSNNKIQIEQSSYEVKRNEDDEITIRFVDPFLKRIAKRLLRDGKEASAVAKKLNLPEADIRKLERTLRNDSAPKESTHTIERVTATDAENQPATLSEASVFTRRSILI